MRPGHSVLNVNNDNLNALPRVFLRGVLLNDNPSPQLRHLSSFRPPSKLNMGVKKSQSYLTMGNKYRYAPRPTRNETPDRTSRRHRQFRLFRASKEPGRLFRCHRHRPPVRMEHRQDALTSLRTIIEHSLQLPGDSGSTFSDHFPRGLQHAVKLPGHAGLTPQHAPFPLGKDPGVPCSRG